MNKSEVDGAVRKAIDLFDDWNDVVGIFEKHSGYYCEILGVIEDAAHCGIRGALEAEDEDDDDGWQLQ